jgi:hypothetical protein
MPFLTSTIYYGGGLYGDGPYIEAEGQEAELVALNNALRPSPDPIRVGINLREDIIFGDLVLNRIDENGIVWVCTDIEGWWNLPDPEIPDIARGWGDGSYDASGRWAARQLTLSGVILPPSSDYVSTARDTLIQQSNLVRKGVWLKTLESPTRASFVRLSGRPQILTVNARGRTEFVIGLRAADPIKYSWNDDDPEGYDIVTLPCKNIATMQTGAVTIENVGNTPVNVFLEITGPSTGPLIVYNTTNDQILTVVESLRSSEVRSVTQKALTSGEATLTLSTSHAIRVGDTVLVTGIDATFNGEHLVIDVPTSTSITYLLDAANVSPTSASGTVTRGEDVVETDTYTQEVAINGETIGARAYLDTLTDWLQLEPGVNQIQFSDIGEPNSSAVLKIYYRSGWIG